MDRKLFIENVFFGLFTMFFLSYCSPKLHKSTTITKKQIKRQFYNRFVKVPTRKREDVFDPSVFRWDLDVYSEYHFDSLTIVEFEMDLEKEFNIQIDDKIVSSIKTPNDAIEVVYNCLKNK
jgi:acyl carrier protein